MAQQPPAKVDYARDIAPLLHQECVGCHGPSRQNANLRLDRRSSAMKPGTRRIVPGSSENSFVSVRLHANPYGQQMPLTGELKPAEITLIKRWIDEGAEWPDAMANEVDLPPASAQAIALIDLLRTGKVAAFLQTVTASPTLLNARGPNGSTPFMYAVLYTGAPTLSRLIALGAQPNAHNDDGATPLMWAAQDLEKTRVLLAHRVDVNAISQDNRSALMIAARTPGSAPIVRLLLAYGANPNPNPHPEGQSSPLFEATLAADPVVFQLLLDHGAKVTTDGENLMAFAIMQRCIRCFELTVPRVKDKAVYTAALEDAAIVPDVRSIQVLLDHGADPKGADAFGRTALMYAATSDAPSLEVLKLLVAHGADVNAKDGHKEGADAGRTALDMARSHGNTPEVQFLLASGAKAGDEVPLVWHPRRTNDLHSAIQSTLPHLQRADFNFTAKSGCASCHDNSLTAMTVSLARKQGFTVDETIAHGQVKVNIDMLAQGDDILLQSTLGLGDIFGPQSIAYMLMGLAAEGYKPDLTTDASAMYILSHQSLNGEWIYPVADTRQPICLDHIGSTVKSMRGLQLYMPQTGHARYRLAIARAGDWLATARSDNNEDRSWRVQGLAWEGNHKAALAQAVHELEAAQKADGGFADLPTMESTAYATGKSLVALHTAGVAVTSPVYQRGVQWLLAHQEEDGTWHDRTRSLAFQPDFDAGFPHGNDQWISAAGTNWAAMALTYALPRPAVARASGQD